VATSNDTPSGERIGFSVEADGVMMIRIDDGALISTKPVVADVIKSIDGDGRVTYFLKCAIQTTIKEPPVSP
jgi:hypothetical protein